MQDDGPAARVTRPLEVKDSREDSGEEGVKPATASHPAKTWKKKPKVIGTGYVECIAKERPRTEVLLTFRQKRSIRMLRTGFQSTLISTTISKVSNPISKVSNVSQKS
jgi:hypothetical protein